MVQRIQFSGQNSNRANTAFTIGLLTILGALSSQYIGGLVPCELCLLERIPYYVGLPILFLLIAFWKNVPPLIRLLVTFVVIAIFLWSTWLGAYHAGVEWGFWQGPTACTGAGAGVSFDALSDINAADKIVACDEVQWRLFGISMAGYNGLVSLLIAAILGWSALGQIQRMQSEKR